MSALDWLDSKFIALENSLNAIWNSLVLSERQYPVILALATFIVLYVLIGCLCNWCCWCCGLCRPRQKHPGFIFVPANYGTVMYPPQLAGGEKQPLLQQPTPSTSHQAQPTAPMNV